MMLGDLPGAVRSFEWFEQTFPNDIGEPFHSLCWTLALYRSGNTPSATRKLLQTMLLNLYLIPHLLGLEQKELDIWHWSNFAEKDYVQYTPPEILGLWDEQAREWAKETFQSRAFSQIRARYIEIYQELKHEPRGPRRTQLVDEAFRLQGLDPDWSS